MFPLPHLDDVAGLLAGFAQWFGSDPPDTLDGLHVYEQSSLADIFPVPEGTPHLRPRQRWRFGGLVSEDLIFPSAHEPLEARFAGRYRDEYPETQTVYARRVRPTGPGRRPRLLYYHGYMQPETPLEEVAILATMARQLDVEVIQIQPPYHGRRTPRASWFGGELYWTGDIVRSIEAVRQSVLDARMLLNWLLDEDDRPIGICGLSLGGALTLLLTCLEARFAFSVPLIAHMDLAALLADAPVLERMRRDLRRRGWGPADFEVLLQTIGWYDLRPRVPVDRIFLFGASDDRFFRPERVECMWEQWGQPRIRWCPSSHMGFLAYTPQAMGEVREFVDDCLGRSVRLGPP